MRLIDADKLWDALNGVGGTGAEPDSWADGYDKGIDVALGFVEPAPTVDIDPESIRPHGRWIEYTKVIIRDPYNKWEQAWKCSECGFDDGFVDYNYCPNCGAKMDGGAD